MTTGVAMAAYNGSAYIEAQLESLRAQSQPPDQVSIRDDGSKDGTPDLASQFIKIHGLAPIPCPLPKKGVPTAVGGGCAASWRVFQNPVQLGCYQNFYAAMDDLETDLIFLSDQDDLWLPDKIRKMAQVMEQRPKIAVLCCAHDLIDDADRPLKTIRYERFKGTGAISPVGASRLVRAYAFPGMCLALRRDFYLRVRDAARAIDAPHDRALCLLAEAENGMYLYDEILARHRMHDNNVGGEKNRARDYLRRGGRIKDLETMLGWLNALREADAPFSDAARAAMGSYAAALALRLGGLKRRTLLPGLRAKGKYPQDVPWRALMADGAAMITR